MRWLFTVLVGCIASQVYYTARIGWMAFSAPTSTTFERTQAWQLLRSGKPMRWREQWVDYAQISDHLKRAVISSEDDDFVNHDGVEWEALEKAWKKNEQAQARVQAQAPKGSGAGARPAKAPKIVGGSTITQQLAKNLFLSGERTLWRKGQEFLLTVALEALLSKQRILEIYLNHVEWGEGVFGAEAAARHYFRKSASQLSAWEAARLAVMLPRPRYFEKLPNSGYLADRAQVIVGRMGGAELP